MNNCPPTSADVSHAKNLIQKHGLRGAARETGLHTTTLSRILKGKPVGETSLVSLRAVAHARTAYGARTVVSPPGARGFINSWSLEDCRDARDAQLDGRFTAAAPLADALMCNPAIFAVAHNRVAPIGALKARFVTRTARAQQLARKLAKHVSITRETLLSITHAAVLHGVAFAYIRRELASADGETVNYYVDPWPIRCVNYDPLRDIYYATNHDGTRIDITPGDGTWVMFARRSEAPFRTDACLPAAALVFAAHTDAFRDWCAGSFSHGSAKVVGQLPEGVPMQDADGGLTPDAETFLHMITGIASGEAGAGISPAGASVTVLSNTSTQWSVWSELTRALERLAARLFLGTDAVMGSTSDAPGVDASALFGVATTKTQGDVDMLTTALNEQVYRVWIAEHYGNVTAPQIEFALPDADSDKVVEQKRKAYAALKEIVDAHKTSGFELTQEVIDDICKELDIVPPKLAQSADVVVPIQLAPTDLAKVVKVREARMSNGLPALGDERDEMTITEFSE